jgi:mRNA interferase MazF
LKRGDIVLVAPAGEFGKPRPALIIQSDAAFPSGYFTYLPITSELLRVPDIRVPIAPSPENGLRVDSEVMADMIQTSSQARFRQTIGVVESGVLRSVEASMILHLGLDT